GASRSADDRRRFSIPCAVAVGTRRPVNRVFQNAWDRVVVLRSHEQDGVRLPYALLPLHNFRRRVLLVILIEARDAVKFEDFDRSAFRHELGRCAQDVAVVGFASKTASDPQDAYWFDHVPSSCFPCASKLRMLASGAPVAIHSPAVAAFGSSPAVPAAFGSATHYGTN